MNCRATAMITGALLLLLLLSAAHPAEHNVLPYHIEHRAERGDGAGVRLRNPDHEHRILLSHALGACDGVALAVKEPAEEKEKHAEHGGKDELHLENAGAPEQFPPHGTDVVARAADDDEYVEAPDIERVFLIVLYFVCNLRVERAESERDRERNGNDGLDGIEYASGHREVFSGISCEIAEDKWNGEAGDEMAYDENLEREHGVSAEDLGHRGSRVRRGREADDEPAEQKRLGKPERVVGADERRAQDEAREECMRFYL